jgi:pimeloyl-ACP methyl ester carboxylesterase
MTSRPSPESRVPGRVLSTDGTPIAFEQSGAGPSLILVSSALADRSDARRLARHLTPAFTVINYDRRGRGASGDTAPYAIAREVEDLEALIHHAGGPASLFGSSSGAALALEAAERLGDQVWRLVLFEPPFIVDDSRPPLGDDDTRQLTAHLDAGRSGPAVAFFMRRFLGMPRVAVAVMRLLPMWRKLERLAPTLAYDLALMHGTQTGAPLPADRWTNVSQRTLVLAGQKSDAFLHRSAAALAQILPAAEAGTLPGASHSAVAAAPKKLARAVGQFLREP